MRTVALRPQIYATLWWMCVVPIVATWPFISAFPVFGILEANQFDLNTALDSAFAMTGFWPMLAIDPASWYAMGRKPRAQIKTTLAHFRIAISGYIYLWTGLYMAFVILR